MANQLDLARAASKRPLYEVIKFSDFHPSMHGELKIRVNLSRGMWRQMKQTQALQARAKDLPAGAERAALEAEASEMALALIASLIPREAGKDEPISVGEYKAFLEYQTENSDAEDEDMLFDNWLTDEIIRRIMENQKNHFLARAKSKNGSTPTPDP